MEHLDKIEECLGYIHATLDLCSTRHGVAIGEINTKELLGKLNQAFKELNELRKIQNYTNASVPAKEEPKEEMVNHPSYYQGNKYECIDVMLDVFGKEKVSAFCELNAFKYQWRANSKGTNIQDKEKAIWYNQKYIDLNKEKQ